MYALCNCADIYFFNSKKKILKKFLRIKETFFCLIQCSQDFKQYNLQYIITNPDHTAYNLDYTVYNPDSCLIYLKMF